MKNKEEILKKWRGIGFLNGLKNGSINEWRCAVSYEDFANYILNGEHFEGFGLFEKFVTDNHNGLVFVGFPFIRRVLTRGKKRLHRFIEPNEIDSFFNDTKMGELFDYVIDNYPKKNKTSFGVWCNISKLGIYNDMSILDFLYGKNDNVELLKKVLFNILDIEAEVVAVSSSYFAFIKSHK